MEMEKQSEERSVLKDVPDKEIEVIDLCSDSSDDDQDMVDSEEYNYDSDESVVVLEAPTTPSIAEKWAAIIFNDPKKTAADRTTVDEDEDPGNDHGKMTMRPCLQETGKQESGQSNNDQDNFDEEEDVN